jgi:hypothetical protein
MKLLRRIDYWLNRSKRDAELAEELEFHRAMAGEPIGNTTIARQDARVIAYPAASPAIAARAVPESTSATQLTG